MRAVAVVLDYEVGVAAEVVVLAWVLRHPAGVQPVVGTTNVGRIAEACAALDVRLSREDWYALFEAARGAKVP